MKFLITPNYAAPYDQRMVDGLAQGLIAAGQEAMSLAGPVSAADIRKLCLEQAFDVVIQVNRTRHPEVELPPAVRHVAWYQDVFPETTAGFAGRFESRDILYALGDPFVLGLAEKPDCLVGSLLSGVDESVFAAPVDHSASTIDFSLCGYIPPPISRKRFPWRYLRPGNVPYATFQAMEQTVRRLYCPLCGELDIHRLAQEIREATRSLPHRPPNIWKLFPEWLLRARRRVGRAAMPDPNPLPPFERALSYFVREYPRLLDRTVLVNTILDVSHSVKLYGPGWAAHPEFAPYFQGVLDTQAELLEVYQRSRINLANNTHGLGLHSRTLECMAVGGFILMHVSPNDLKAGGMLTAFEPGIHYGSYTPETLAEQAERWLRDETGRRRVGEQAAAIVREKHRWYHRAQQILSDLKQ